MGVKTVNVVGLVVVALVLVSLLYLNIVATQKFASNVPEERRNELRASEGIYRSTAEILWSKRFYDTVFQGIVVFTATICILCLLRREVKGGM